MIKIKNPSAKLATDFLVGGTGVEPVTFTMSM